MGLCAKQAIPSSLEALSLDLCLWQCPMTSCVAELIGSSNKQHTSLPARELVSSLLPVNTHAAASCIHVSPVA